MPSRTLRLSRDDRCVVCSAVVAAGTPAFWDAKRRTVTCTTCLATASEPLELDRGRPGASADREYQRRKRNRERRTLEAHPHLGRTLLKLGAAPQHELAFDRGRRGEAAVAKTLEARTAGGPAIVLHDRRMPRGRGNIDHLAIAPNGVFVIDAKDWSGKVRVTSPRPGERKLMINGRDQTKLVDGVDRQVDTVRAILAETLPKTPVQGVLCFTQADLPMLGTLSLRSHLLLYRRALAKRLNAGGPLTREQIGAIAHTLAAAFPPA
jgi:hypothetical protein